MESCGYTNIHTLTQIFEYSEITPAVKWKSVKRYTLICILLGKKIFENFQLGKRLR